LAERYEPRYAVPHDLPLPELSDNARTILEKRYLIRDDHGQIVETPRDLFWRVARTVAEEDRKYGKTDEQIDRLAREFYALMIGRLFEPNSPTLSNAGKDRGQLSACFVLPVDDTISNGKSGIYDTLRSMALIHQSGGGTGFSFSRLRRAGARVRTTTGVASGPVSFMRLYDASTEAIKQGGTRRGANMGILRVDHPDIKEFVDCKQDVTQITNFNVSVAATDDFMRAVKSGGLFDITNSDGSCEGTKMSARGLFDKIVDRAWSTGEPGLFFVDAANRANPVPHLGRYEATNPCGEQPLLPYDVCNLGSVNVGAFVRPDGTVDWMNMKWVVKKAVHFLDNIIDANCYPLPEIEDLAKRIRRIGLGIMGFADFLVRRGIAYDSSEGVEAGRILMMNFQVWSHDASRELAEDDKRGVYPEWKNNPVGAPRRNCNVTTVAPTGTISIFANCSGGIEPLFGVAFKRYQADTHMVEVNEDFRQALLDEDFTLEEIDEQVGFYLENGRLSKGCPESVRRVFKTANEIGWEWHVRIQAAFQESCDSAISKTINLSNDATRDEVAGAYMLAWELGCKGITVYRDGCRPMQVLSTGATTNPNKAEVVGPIVQVENTVSVPVVTDRPALLEGKTTKAISPEGDAYVTVNRLFDREYEVFITLGKSGGTANAHAEALGRLISLALQNGAGIDSVIKQLRGISSDRAIGIGPNRVLSLPDAVARALSMLAGDNAPPPAPSQPVIAACGVCSGALSYSEGCVKCMSCGFAECG
jgi:ribonucleoside-diphosphate reductase alpha chain